MYNKKGHHRHRNGYMNGTNGAGSGLETPPEPAVVYRPNPESFLPLPRLSFRQAAVIVFAVSVVCFAISYDGDFVFDDSEAILGNTDLLPETPLSGLFFNDFWGNKLDSKTSHKSYRPLTVLTFRLSHMLAGGLSPPWFHIPNIILHGVVSVSLLWMFSILFGGYVVTKATGEVRFMATRSSLLAALLFAVHPVHTESVSGVVGRADLLCALLFVGSFILYVKACASDLDEKEENLVVNRPETFSIQTMLISMMLCALSVFCKEQGVTVIGICSAYDILVVCRVDLLQLIGMRGVSAPRQNGDNGKDKPVEPWILSLVKRQLVLMLTGVAVLLFRWRIMGSTTPTFQVFDNPHSFVDGALLRGLNYNYLYSINAWLLLCPWWLCFDWSMGCVPVLESFHDPRILAVLAVWLGIAALLWACLKGPITQDQRTLTVGLALIIVTFLPASNLFFRVGFVVAERILYLPSIGFCVLVVLGVRQLCVTYPHYNKVVQAGIMLVLAVFIGRCIQRSSQWRNEMELFSSGATVCTGNAKVHYNIAKVNADIGNTEYAIEKYRQAIELNPRYDQAMNNLGNIMKDQGQLEEGEKLLENAVSINKEFAAAWMNLGIIKASLKKYAEAERSYGNAILHRRNYPDCFYNLGNLYLDVKQSARAIEAWTNATILRPTHSNAWVNMAVLYDQDSQYVKSIETIHKALKHLPDEPQLFFSLGNVHGKLEQYAESEKHFLKAIKLKPTAANYYANLGVLYHRWKKYDKAEVSYKKALQLNPNESNVREHLKMVRNKES